MKTDSKQSVLDWHPPQPSKPVRLQCNINCSKSLVEQNHLSSSARFIQFWPDAQPAEVVTVHFRWVLLSYIYKPQGEVYFSGFLAMSPCGWVNKQVFNLMVFSAFKVLQHCWPLENLSGYHLSLRNWLVLTSMTFFLTFCVRTCKNLSL